ncbi:uncharacterized protein K452DRAFT_59280 [Aplosporella prunicola CBS 121167]|uniref:Uncharacterized protein n=1 Tax=Aplosporella prunicola CBS 121167 TaxID=1176127 RepID=A0A6A6BAR9_9PEZI|nr:uncharacterized protein K452DRAFT_59280 [Aplosporella prunicola CBS 121167]KAF2140007.1 hypothetical protein K452DRAFT_59280 [Aplosporella prunicola CBS 121167]
MHPSRPCAASSLQRNSAPIPPWFLTHPSTTHMPLIPSLTLSFSSPPNTTQHSSTSPSARPSPSPSQSPTQSHLTQSIISNHPSVGGPSKPTLRRTRQTHSRLTPHASRLTPHSSLLTPHVSPLLTPALAAPRAHEPPPHNVEGAAGQQRCSRAVLHEDVVFAGAGAVAPELEIAHLVLWFVVCWLGWWGWWWGGCCVCSVVCGLRWVGGCAWWL